MYERLRYKKNSQLPINRRKPHTSQTKDAIRFITVNSIASHRTRRTCLSGFDAG